jgi:hypothetical protein
MNKLKIHTIYYKDVFRSVNIHPNYAHIEEYLNGGRQDILENFDIFYENVRSHNRKYKNFDLFDSVDKITDDCVIVIGFYLELLEFWGQRNKIYDIVKYYCNLYVNNKIVVTWNHDIDASFVFNFMDEFPNLYVLNFNTSVNHDRYILLPFWTIDENNLFTDKKYLTNLVCSFNNSIRINIKNSLNNTPNIFISEKVSFDQYKQILSESKFTLCPKGLGLSSYRFFECFHLNTIPVLFADDVILPYQDRLNYDDFIIRIPEKKSNDGSFILNKINTVDYAKMLTNLNKVKDYFTLKGVQEEIKRRLI